MNEPMRLDAALVARGMVGGRDKAKQAIADGMVRVNGRVVTKASSSVCETDEIVCERRERFVGRGGEKLQKALCETALNVRDRVCADIGASTGGFTDCLLQHGARLVYAVDVGHGQLAPSLCEDPRVVNMENTDVRHRETVEKQIPNGSVDICTVDVSFISLSGIFDSLLPLLRPDGHIVCLVKPQFEAGRAALSKRGVVRREKDHIRVLQTVMSEWQQRGLGAVYLSWSPICGGDGNIEYIALLSRTQAGRSIDVTRLVKDAFAALRS